MEIWLREKFTERVKTAGISTILDITARIESLTYALSPLIRTLHMDSIFKQKRKSHLFFHQNKIFK
jgi:hypothetical protein